MVKKRKMNVLDWIVFSLVIIGGINWGLVGIFQFNLVEWLLGKFPMIVRIVYGLVGVSSLYALYPVVRANLK